MTSTTVLNMPARQRSLSSAAVWAAARSDAVAPVSRPGSCAGGAGRGWSSSAVSSSASGRGTVLRGAHAPETTSGPRRGQPGRVRSRRERALRADAGVEHGGAAAGVARGGAHPPAGGRGRAGLVVEDVETGWVGAVLRTEKSGGVHLVVLEDRRGRTRAFPLGPDSGSTAPRCGSSRPRPRRPARPTRTASGSGRGPRRAGAHRARLPDPRRGPARRRTRREGLGRRPARRGGRRRDARRRRRPGRRRPRHGARARPPPRRARRPPRRRQQGVARGRRRRQVGRRPRPRPRRRAPLRRRVAGGAPAAPRAGRLADGAARAPMEGGRARPSSAGRTRPRRRSPRAGAGSSAPVRSFADLEPALLGRVEELIDFVTGDDADR
jgi:hypothetical protein